MNKTAIKNFAIWARNKLIADISYRAGLMGITAEGIQKALPQSTGTTEFYDIGTAEPYSVSGDAVKQRKSLVDKIRAKEKETNYQTAYKYVIEEVAYTWFNRLIAVRFMEVNDYLPSNIRVLSSDSGKMEPDLVTTPFEAELSFSADEEQEIYRLKQENKVDEVFRILFIKQCNALNEILPALFEKTADYTELLLNLSVIDQDGVVWHLVHDIPEEDFNIELGGQVEIIGWLYQYYNTEPKNEAFAKSGKITKEEIPAVTQLFTPDWIVRYMVENSVGRLWIEHLRALDESKDEAELAAGFGWKYYLPEAKQEPEVEAKLRELRRERLELTPEQITMIDPCMGSGHILVYGFSVLMQIYESAGYGQRDAARSILEHNLYGLDIDDRAYQMAYFAVMMKAREYNRRILNGENTYKVYAIQESNGITDAALGDMGGSLSEDERQKALKEINTLIAEFKDAKEYGSILNIERRDWDLLRRFAVPNVGVGQLSLDMNGAEPAANRLQEIIDIAEVVANKYFTAVTNPPYMVIGNGTGKLIQYVQDQYPNNKTDLYAVFIEKCHNLLSSNGYQAMITQHSWMFLSSFEKLRQSTLKYTCVNMAHLGPRAFDEISGEVVQTTSFVMRAKTILNYTGRYLRLLSGESESAKMELFLSKANESFTSQDKFDAIPGAPYAYWLNDTFLDAFRHEIISKVAKPRQGLATGDNDRFLRLWYEPNFENLGFGCKDRDAARDSKKKWFPCNKGGTYRRWFGNNDYIVDWENDGFGIKNNRDANGRQKSRPQNMDYYFRKGITWSTLANKLSMRLSPTGFMFETKGSVCFPDNKSNLYYLLGLLNSKVAEMALSVLSPTLDFHEGPVGKVPAIIIDERDKVKVDEYVRLCTDIAKEDWDSFETSWDYKMHPIVRKALSRLHWNDDGDTTLEYVYKFVAQDFEDRFRQLKANEEELNRIFIDIYGLQDELTPEVDDRDVTVRKADLQRDIKSLLSYAVGCMFGRYSLDTEGLAYAGGTWDASKYSSFLPDADNVIPITDEEYLEDDIVTRLCTWLKAVYGEATLEQNLDFIADALGNKGNSSRDVIRNYFLNDFFKDHCQTYSVTGSGKRPIYWLFDSGKQNGFKALIYLHRYNADTIGNLRIDYLHRMQRIYESEIGRMQDMIDHSTSGREVAQSTKRREKLQKQLKECREYDERLAHLALSRIELDLDDGVKVNYRKIQTANDGKFYEVLADSKNIMTKK
jgi:hypothetical protein